jgi:tetratricopeptide (TPR) repeat protein
MDASASARLMRVFISSTFRDMQEERDALVKHVFPRLRAACEARAVAWGEVDLRWGITEEDAAEGRVLPICLAEIESCRPFFIGLLGERYGYVPARIDPTLTHSLPWLDAAAGASVTELEIVHGVLNDPAMATRAFFYFRDPDAGFSEDAESGAARARLSDLKARIRAAGVPVRESYRDASELAELVHADLAGALDASFPETDSPSPEQREALDRRQFAALHAAQFAGRNALIISLEAALANGGVYVVAGETGAGKSAVLAHIVERAGPSPHPLEPAPVASVPPRSIWRRLFGGAALPAPKPISLAPRRVIEHWVGCAPGTDQLVRMLRGLVRRLQRECGLVGNVPDTVDQLVPCFVDHLRMAARRAPVVVVIDGVDRLAAGQGGPDLLWLPRELPAGAAILLSTRPGRTLDAARDRGATVIELPPLDVADRRAITATYLAHYRKALGARQMEALTDAAATNSPAFLRAALERLRVFGRHEELDAAIRSWTAADDLPDLQVRVLVELEVDHGRELVMDVFALLAASRHGLEEAELRDLAGGGGVPMAVLSPVLVNAAGLIERVSGRLALTNETLRDVVLARTAPEAGARQALHRRLAAYLSTRDDRRQAEELLWQLERGGDQAALVAALASPTLLAALEDADRLDDALNAWRVAEERGAGRMSETYRDIIGQPWTSPAHALRVGTLLLVRGYTTDAKELLDWLSKADRFGLGDLRREARTRLLLARLVDHPALATHHLAQAAVLAQRAGDRVLEGGAKMEFGNVLLASGAPKQALQHFSDAVSVFEATGATLECGLALNNRGIAQERSGQRRKALRTYREAEQILERAGAVAGVARAVEHQAGALYFSGDAKGATDAWNRSQRLFHQTGDDNGLLVSLTNVGMMLALGPQPELAMGMMAHAESLAKQMPLSDAVAKIYEISFIICMRGDIIGRPAFRGIELISVGLQGLARAIDIRERVGGFDKLKNLLMLAADYRRKAGDPTNAQLFELQAERLGIGAQPPPRVAGIRTDESFKATSDYFVALHRSDADWAEQIERARRAQPADLVSELKWRGHGLRGQRRLEEAIAAYEEMGDAARSCGDIDTAFRSYEEKVIASGMAGDSTGAAGHALAQLNYATELVDPSRISAAVTACHQRGVGREIQVGAEEVELLVERIRGSMDVVTRIDAMIALSSAAFLPVDVRQRLLDEGATAADVASLADRAAMAREARLELTRRDSAV